MISLQFEFDTREVRDAFASLASGLDEALEGAVRAGAAVVVQQAKSQHSYRDRTGRLTRSIRAYAPRGRFTRGTLAVEIIADTPYASYVERGTSRSRAYPYLTPAWERSDAYFAMYARDALEEAVRAAGLNR